MTKKKEPKDLLPVGRPTSYRPEYCDKIIEFFDRQPFTPVLDSEGNPCLDRNGHPVLMPCTLPTLAGFAIKMKTHRETILNWTRKYPEFLDAYQRAKAMQEEILVQNGLAGNYEKAFAIFLAKNVTSMKDYKAVEIQTTETQSSQENVKTLQSTKKADKEWKIEFVDKTALLENKEDK